MYNHILKIAVFSACAGMSLAVTGAEDGATTVGGKAYFDFTNIDNTSNGEKVDPSGTGADAKRFYLSVSHGFDALWSANLTTDFNYTSATNETQLFVKKAYLQAKLSDAAIISIGSNDLPWIPFVETLYGYRYVENTLIDRLKFGTSADWGLHLKGKQMGGMVKYAVSVVNGNGYKNPSRSKSMDISARISVNPVKGLTLGAAYRNGKLGQETQTTSTANTASRVDLVADYRFSMYNVGVEYFNAKNYTSTAVSTGPEDRADGYSVWGTVTPTEKVAVFARYDYAKPSKDLNNSLKDTYYNLGVSYKARKHVDLALVYKYDKVENGSISTSNGNIGGINTSTNGQYREIGLWTQVKF